MSAATGMTAPSNGSAERRAEPDYNFAVWGQLFGSPTITPMTARMDAAQPAKRCRSSGSSAGGSSAGVANIARM
jgi:hypothetical protein